MSLLGVVGMGVGMGVSLALSWWTAAPDTLGAATLLSTQFRVEPDIVYETVALPGEAHALWDGKLDLYLPLHARGPLPTLIHFHGGGWVTGNKNQAALEVLPYLAMGFAVVNVDYRLARVSLAPAAVEDSRCALRWVVRHAAQHGLDPARVVTAGSSAGGHLALMAALVTPAAGFDQRCPGDEPLRVAAVVNLFGVVDVGELLQPAHLRDFALGWLGERPERAVAARRFSPLAYLDSPAPAAAAGVAPRPLPAVVTVHGDADPVVPYHQAQRLHEALARAGARQKLYTVRGGGHGDFGGDEMLRLTRALRDFLRQQQILPPPS